MDNGWIKIHRKILDNAIKTKPDWAWLWVVILLMANHADATIIWNGEKRTIKKGEFITSRQQLANQSGLHPSSVQRALEYFKTEQQIEQQTNKRFRLIKVNNYEQYQAGEQVSEHQMINKRTQTRRIKKNKKNTYMDFVLLTIGEQTKLDELYGHETVNEYIGRLSEYIGSTGKKYKSHYHTILSWIRKDGVQKKMTSDERLKKQAEALGLTYHP